jgi:hypothetical protein
MLLECTFGWKAEVIIAGGQRWFCGMDKTQSHYLSDRDLKNNEPWNDDNNESCEPENHF